MTGVPGFEAIQAQQEAFLKAMTGGMGSQWSGPSPDETDEAPKKKEAASESEDLDAIKTQLAELQKKLSKLDK
jgi:ubiquinone biosynthesis protein UbiJ